MRDKTEREYVLDILTQIRQKNTYSHIAVTQALDEAQKDNLTAQQRAFIKRLAEGVIERQAELDERILRQTRKGTRIKPVIRDILRMGIYQILYMDAVPDSAAVNESVKLVKAQGKGSLSGFVNAVLRKIAQAHRADPEEAASAFMPSWITELWRRQFTKEETDELVRAMMEVRPVTIRVDERLSLPKRQSLICALEEAGAAPAPGRYLPYAYDLHGTAPIGSLPGFAQGDWTVQDESSMMVAEAAGLKGGEVIYDLCAAPGGKSLHCASKLAASGKGGRVCAFDLSSAKMKLIRENAARMKLYNIEVSQRDARIPFPEGEREIADVLLCDLPCSGLGVMGHKRDIKYRVKPEQIEALTKLQREILCAGITALRPGGTLLYSTCTIDRAENEEIAAFLEEELRLIPDPLYPFLPDKISGIRGNELQLLPSRHGTDGFYIARFIKPA